MGDHFASSHAQIFSSEPRKLSFHAVPASTPTFQALNIPAPLDGRAWFHGSGYRWRRRVHRHAELEVNLVVSGRATYLVDEARYDLTPGTMIWLHPEQDHLLVNESPDYTMWLAVWRPESVSRICSAPASWPLTLPRPGGIFSKRLVEPAAEALDRLWRHALDIGETQPDRLNALLAHLLLECWVMFREADELSPRHDVHPAVERAARLLRYDAEARTIDDIAAHAGLSPSQLSRLFKRQMGLSITEYRQRQCLQRFFEHYGSGGGTDMTSAALAAGFGSYPQFYRVFKHHMGHGPAEHRRRQRH